MATPRNNWVSPNYTEADKGTNPSESDLVEVFRDRVDGWQLAIAEEMLRQVEDSATYPAMRHAGYTLISVVFSYFEMVGQIIGRGQQPSPTEDFVRGFKDVYPKTRLTTGEIKIIYGRVRCGMYHDGYTKRGVYISSRYKQTFEMKKGIVLLNPHLLIPDLRTHFGALTLRLEDPRNKKLRANLLKLMKQSPNKKPAITRKGRPKKKKR